jgi:hypothetical protein
MQSSLHSTLVTVVSAILLVGCCATRRAPSQAEADLFGVGDWSETVADAQGYKLRGRLVLCAGQHLTGLQSQFPEIWQYTRVYLELQHVYLWNRYSQVELFDAAQDLRLELRDGLGKPAIPGIFDAEGRAAELAGSYGAYPGWVTLPFDTTVRLRVDLGMYSTSKTDTQVIWMERECWMLPANSRGWTLPVNPPGDYFLSGTFSPSTNHPSSLAYHVWHGTLKLPPVKISSKKS